jgi:hypothetical protein
MATHIYKRAFKGQSLDNIHAEIGKRGGVVVRIDRKGEETTAYYEADSPGPSTEAVGYDEREVSVEEVTKI